MLNVTKACTESRLLVGGKSRAPGSGGRRSSKLRLQPPVQPKRNSVCAEAGPRPRPQPPVGGKPTAWVLVREGCGATGSQRLSGHTGAPPARGALCPGPRTRRLPGGSRAAALALLRQPGTFTSEQGALNFKESDPAQKAKDVGFQNAHKPERPGSVFSRRWESSPRSTLWGAPGGERSGSTSVVSVNQLLGLLTPTRDTGLSLCK